MQNSSSCSRWAFAVHRRVADYSFTICGDDPQFLPLCEAIYPNSSSRDGGGGAPLYRLERERGGYVTARSPNRLLRRARHASRLFVPLEWWITYDILDSTRQHLHLHGGGFRAGNAAVLFPGAHGAGKTSLTLEALYRGYQVFGDEILVVDPAKRMLLPHPRCFVVKQSGFGLFPHLRALYRTRSPQKVGRSLNVWYVDPSEIRPDFMATAAPCRTLIFPRFRKGSGTDIAPVSEIDAVGRLLSCVFTFFPNTEASLSGVAALARGCEAFELRFGHLRKGFDAIEELLAERRSG